MTGNHIRISDIDPGFDIQPFEGPLDLLLYLIKQDEIDIYDIPIAQITRQYLAYLEAMRELDLEVAGEFILMAAMLIRIKAQMLLPKQQDELEDCEDPRSGLVKALLEYRQFRSAAQELEKARESWQKRYPRGGQYEGISGGINYQLEPVDINALVIAFGELLRHSRKAKDHLVDVDEVSIDQRIGHIIDKLESRGEVEFGELFEDDPRRIVIAVTFMAILELVRLGQLFVKQAAPFGKIWIARGRLNREKAMKLYAHGA